MANEYFSNVWDAIAAPPEDADNLRLRDELMGKIADRMAEWEMTQEVAAERLGITQLRFSDLVSGVSVDSAWRLWLACPGWLMIMLLRGYPGIPLGTTKVRLRRYPGIRQELLP